MAHFVDVCKLLNLLVLLFQKHLHQEHLSLLLDQVPTVLSVLRAFNWHIEACGLGDIDFVRNVRVDSKSGRLNVGFTQLAQTALSRWPVLLPNFKLLVCLAFAFFS